MQVKMPNTVPGTADAPLFPQCETQGFCVYLAGMEGAAVV